MPTTKYPCPYCHNKLYQWHDGSLVCSVCDINYSKDLKPIPRYEVVKYQEEEGLDEATESEKRWMGKILGQNIQNAKDKGIRTWDEFVIDTKFGMLYTRFRFYLDRYDEVEWVRFEHSEELLTESLWNIIHDILDGVSTKERTMANLVSSKEAFDADRIFRELMNDITDIVVLLNPNLTFGIFTLNAAKHFVTRCIVKRITEAINTVYEFEDNETI